MCFNIEHSLFKVPCTNQNGMAPYTERKAPYTE